MKAIDKANELVERYNILLSVHIFNGVFDIAQQSALIAVNEIIKAIPNYEDIEYWHAVKQEIEKL
jgi:hypothetical protein